MKITKKEVRDIGAVFGRHIIHNEYGDHYFDEEVYDELIKEGFVEKE